MFTFNGVTASTMSINANRKNVNSIPDQINYFEYIDRKDGVYDFGTNFKEKYITFECNFLPQTSEANAMALIDNLNKYFNPKLGVKTLTLDYLTGRQYYARLANSLDFEMLVLTGAKFDLNFICPDPYAYATSSTNHNYTTAGTYYPSISGTAEVRPLITIIADLAEGDSNIFLNFNNSQVIELKPVLETTYRLEIDCLNYTAKYIEISSGDEYNGLEYMEQIMFPVLQVGSNTFEIIDDSSTITSVDIDYNARYF